MFDCEQCKKKCKSICCGYVPIGNPIIAKHPIGKPYRKVPFHIVDDMTMVVGLDDMCAYLENGTCSIYEDRPDVCRKFGDESANGLVCPYQDKNGRIRSRQERRAIDRGIQKQIDQIIK